MNAWRLRTEWVERIPGLELQSSLSDQHLVSYEPRDATHYEMSLSPARFANLSNRMGCGDSPYWQLSVWQGSGRGNGTMLIKAGSSGTCVAHLEDLFDTLRCSEYSARVFSILIHGCLASHDLSVAQGHLADFRKQGRLGFIDPDAA